jgi:hypothetical protein
MEQPFIARLQCFLCGSNFPSHGGARGGFSITPIYLKYNNTKNDFRLSNAAIVAIE